MFLTIIKLKILIQSESNQKVVNKSTVRKNSPRSKRNSARNLSTAKVKKVCSRSYNKRWPRVTRRRWTDSADDVNAAAVPLQQIPGAPRGSDFLSHERPRCLVR
jgi:hypothetical protein